MIFMKSPAVVLSCLFVDNAGKFYFTATVTDTGFRLSSATLLGAGTAAAMYILCFPALTTRCPFSSTIASMDGITLKATRLDSPGYPVYTLS
jgi:hypothetical protein